MHTARKDEVSIKVHCIVSCLCEVIRLRSGDIDYRPFYLGLWDAPFDTTAQGDITYYQHDLNHDHYYRSFEMLFGAKVEAWHDPRRSPRDNLAALRELLRDCPPDRYVAVQIDMSLMPERSNKFHQKPFPHFLMLSETGDPEHWFMRDPDFRWEGVVPKDRVVQAFLGNPFGGGFFVDAARLRPPTAESVDLYYHRVYTPANGLTNEVRARLAAIAAERPNDAMQLLHRAVKQLPVLAIRKYSYEHALMYFLEETGEDPSDFGYYADLVEEIVAGFNNVQYQVVKMTMTGSVELMPAVLAKLDVMNRTESLVKQELQRLHRIWKDRLADRARADRAAVQAGNRVSP